MFKPNKRDTYLKKKEMEMFCFKAVPRPRDCTHKDDAAAVAMSQPRLHFTSARPSSFPSQCKSIFPHLLSDSFPLHFNVIERSGISALRRAKDMSMSD